MAQGKPLLRTLIVDTVLPSTSLKLQAQGVRFHALLRRDPISSVVESMRLLRDWIVAKVRPTPVFELQARAQGRENSAALLRRDFISFGTLPVNYELDTDDPTVLRVFVEGQFLFSAPLAPRSTLEPDKDELDKTP